ncbi:hypothetical protein N799_09850 [Lysobacter arseniciresistens ZS79]|uniref:Uncharacterized protein n=1 Tax=Lysobacter arseniciresistens ZS79 TaxID=913325 RepID=A0A0A0ET95_9GAMM|nr:hypothetical protein [Lysobacter arseniciresistens]KGM54176.1 hypothetical protein N799_09850 [Lysobacter arseniciresistens ZS79]
MSTDRTRRQALYSPETLADMGEKLAAQLAELSARPCVDKCDAMVRELAEATTAVHRLRSALRGHHE